VLGCVWQSIIDSKHESRMCYVLLKKKKKR
jgi:hypothetical protein